ncbi:SDR family oxidoreductase [Actinopolymorpha pittospori]|uniref:Gluconate 5-dehydrogenase n=1 Tax=Actinopolymorpha pittospori TaxID=648752 RepID=A0A927N8Y3_9ACTN|nr:gluconate 5-dehydrogenase [Actinopolymorpha pittospori]
MTVFLDELFSLRGRVALVTGGSSGIGRGIASALGQAGAAVVVVARREPPLIETVAELRRAGCQAGFVRADLADRAEVARTAEEAVAVFGEPDILVHAAGINLRPRMGDLTTPDWDRTLALNLDAAFLLGQRFGPSMAARGWGRIITIGSQQSVRAFGNSGAYGVSKAGILALTRSQAEAWSSSGVRCNAIVPGFVKTPLTQAVFDDPDREEALAARTMVGRNGEPADFMGVAVFLASAAAEYVTGQAIFVDGGFSVS